MAGSAGIRLAAVLCGLAAACGSTDAPRTGGPKPEAVRAFDRYIRLTELVLKARLHEEPGWLWPGTEPLRPRLLAGDIISAPRNTRGDIKIPQALIHDWVGVVFIPGVTLPEVLNVVQDYDHHKETYRHEVMDSRLLDHSGNDYRAYLRLLKRKVITVVLDTEHQIHYEPLSENCWYSSSYSTRIKEVGSPEGHDHGFLWRLNSYWMFLQKDGGVYVECEAVSLSRTVPDSLAWLIGPVVRGLPRETLISTLRATRRALVSSRHTP
ncbi:MAG TPA: hypothetical protein VMI94_16155 [Bryobacteraceae bacterium]|nr:hypothetical protein [Bryobacteraceae bacterium]